MRSGGAGCCTDAYGGGSSFLHTHWILISNYNAVGPIYTHLLRRGAAVETDTSSSTNQLQPSPGKRDGRRSDGGMEKEELGRKGSKQGFKE